MSRFWKSSASALIFGLTLALPARAQPAGFASDPNRLEIKLVTFGVGSEIHQYFGHNALWVRDTALKWGALYNYGMFSFGPDMLPNYMKGRLTFWVAATPVHHTFDHYRAMGRDIIVQELNLPPAARKRIADRLMHDALPENRFYQYHHYTDNCSTRLRDVIDEAVDGQLHAFLSKPAHFNYREETRRYAERSPVVNLALLFWMNDSMEKPIQRWDEMFLPLELSRALDDFEYRDASGKRVRLVSKRYALFKADQPPVPDGLSPTWLGALMVGLLLGAIAVLVGFRRRMADTRLLRILDGSYQSLLGLVFGFPALLGFLMWTLTEHVVTYHNENQLLANPLTFALWPLGALMAFGVRWADRGARLCAYSLGVGAVMSLLLKVLPAFDQDNWIPMALLLPLDLGLAAGHWLRARESRAHKVQRGAS